MPENIKYKDLASKHNFKNPFKKEQTLSKADKSVFIQDDAQDTSTIKKANEQYSETLKQFKNNQKAEYDRFRVNTDTGYFVCLCFQDVYQKEKFMKAIGADEDDNYVDGCEIAQKIGVDLNESIWKPIDVKVHKMVKEGHPVI